ncbi:hypothetical protein DYH55_10380 [Methylovirgula sp. 4M-Z18]|nr:hypothetical protein DYH55_10380 [Methylovirgula sp. 4M-Z18]
MAVAGTGNPDLPISRRIEHSSREHFKRHVSASAPVLAVKMAGDGYLGHAPYICTPSGFGQTSRCFPR